MRLQKEAAMNTEESRENSTEELIARYNAGVSKLVPYLAWLDSHAAATLSQEYGEDQLSHSIAFPVYDSTLLNFVKTAQTTNLMNRNYLYCFRRNRLNTAADELAFIQRAEVRNLPDLADILSKYVLGGMTKGRLWTEGVQNHVMYSVVSKMQELIKKWGGTPIDGR